MLLISCVVFYCKPLQLGQIFLKFSSTLVLRLRAYQIVAASLTIRKQTVSSCVSISSLQDVFLSNFNSQTTYTFVSSASFFMISLSPVSRTPYTLIPDLAMNFTNHIHHFPFSPVKMIMWTFFLPILYFIVFSFYIPPP